MSMIKLIQDRRAILLCESAEARKALAALEAELGELAIAERTLDRLRSADRISCPRCGGDTVYKYTTRRIFKCKACGRQFSATSGTARRHHKMPVELYERGEALIRKGATATDVTRALGIGYKTALGMRHRMIAADATKDPK